MRTNQLVTCRSWLAPFVLLPLLLATIPLGCGSGGNGSPEDEEVFTALYTVTNLNDSGPGSLRSALAAAPDGAGIFFDPTLPAGTITLLSSLAIETSVTIGGMSGASVRFEIDGDNNDRIFSIVYSAQVARVELRDLVLTNGAAGEGGAIDGTVGELVVRRVHVIGCDGSLGDGPGGAIDFVGDLLRAEDCAFTSCVAKIGGAVAIQDAAARFDRCSFYLNQALAYRGGAVRLFRADAVFSNCSFLGNEALDPVYGQGGAVFVHAVGSADASATFYACTIVGNDATFGGGVDLVGEMGFHASAEFHATIVAGNTAGTGADVRLVGGDSSASGSHNVIGTATFPALQNGTDGNRSGTLSTPLNPLLEPVTSDALGRAYRIPAAGSPALNIWPPPVLPGVPDGDLRGQTRPRGGAYDAGAIER